MWSELFLTPFLTGLCLAVLLPALGCYLRLREEWLAALAYAHVAAAGALVGLMLGAAPMLGGVAAAAAVGLGKHALARRLAGGAAYPLLLLAGWSLAILIAANLPLAERLGHALKRHAIPPAHPPKIKAIRTRIKASTGPNGWSKLRAKAKANK